MSTQRGRPKKLDDAVVLYVRSPASLADHLDEWVQELRDKNIGMGGISRADLIRDILLRAVLEHRAAKATPAKPTAKKRAR